jgi:tetratricopeptide (TPR) repeat protein
VSASDRASATLLCLAIALSALCLGAIHTPVLCGIAALLAVAAVVGWFPSAPVRLRPPETILLGLGIGLTGFTVLQGLPLPASVVRRLSPAAADVWAGALAPLHEAGPAWSSLSLDPTATRLQVLRGVVYIAAFIVALRVVSSRGGKRFLSMAILGTALVLAVAAILHPAFGAERVFGIYKPVELHDPRHIAPLLNPNNLAAYLNIGLCVAMGMVLDRRAERLRVLAAGAALLLVAVQLWVASRGGVAAMVVGIACVFLLSWRSDGARTLANPRVLVPSIAVLGGLAAVVLGSSEEAISELHDTDVSKLRLALSALSLARHYPFFGVGRGAFEVAFPSTRQMQEASYIDFEHPENFIAEWVTEWGIPAAIVCIVTLALVLRPRRFAAGSPAIGACAAIITTAAQNLVDFGSEVPAIVLAVAGCAAIVVAERGDTHGGGRRGWGSHPRVVGVAVGAATAVAVAVALHGWPHELDRDRADLFDDITRPAPSDYTASAVRAALTRHPSEPYVPLAGAYVAAGRNESVVPWIERTLSLAPVYSPAHFLLARWVEKRSPGQARLEYRLAFTQSFLSKLQFDRDALQHAIGLVHGFDDAMELAPEPAWVRGYVLESMAGLLEGRLPATRARLDELLRQTRPDDKRPLEREVNDVLTDLGADDAAPWCEDRKACAERGLAAVAALARLEPEQCGPPVARARLEIAVGDAHTALRDLQTAAQNTKEPTDCWRSLGELALAAQDDAYLAVAEEVMSRSGGATNQDVANNLAWVGSLEERRGNYRKAQGYYRKAKETAPDRGDILEHCAHLASQLGLHSEALEGYQKLVTMVPGEPLWRQLADHERALLAREATP